MHGNVVVVSLVAKAGEVACRNGTPALVQLYITGYGFRLNDNQLIYFFYFFAFHYNNCMLYNSLLHCDNRIFFLDCKESLLVDNKAQESGSRKVSADSPGRMSPVSFAECNTQVQPQSRTSVFPHTILSSNCFSFSTTSALQRNNNSSGANHVRPIFTVYVGLLCLLSDGYWVLGVHRFVS